MFLPFETCARDGVLRLVDQISAATRPQHSGTHGVLLFTDDVLTPTAPA